MVAKPIKIYRPSASIILDKTLVRHDLPTQYFQTM